MTEGSAASSPGAEPTTEGEAACPECGAPPSPGAWCIACGARFDAPPREGTAPPGADVPAVSARKFACDACGALLAWDAATGGLRCPFCGGTKAVERDEAYAPVERALEDVPAARRRAEAPKVFRCGDCGAEVRFEGTTVADRCAFCGATAVVERRGDEGRLLPESVLPFAVALEDATARWRRWLGRGWFRPRDLARAARAQGVVGVYVPCWTFDARTWSRWTAVSGWRYTVTVPDGRGGTRMETRTRWAPSSGERRGTYDDVLVAASRGVDPRLLAKVEPFGTAALQPYRAEFLAGWAAEEYAIDLPAGWRVARERIDAAERAACASDVPGDTHHSLRVWTQHGDVRWKHVLLPLWIASYRYRDRAYRFLVNGATGEVAGTAPVSVAKVVLAVALALALAAATFLLVRR